MGIDFRVSSANPDFYSGNDPNQYINYAWLDIDWIELFEVLDIPMTSHCYDYYPKQFTRDDVRDFRDRIAEVVNKTYHVDGEYCKAILEKHHGDAVKLLVYFDYYVANDAIIVVM